MLHAILSDELLVLFLIVTVGLLVGRIKIAGLSLGSSATIFVALAFGQFGYGIPQGLGNLGLVLFIYSVGITAGPTFFRTFVRKGRSLIALAGVLILVAALSTYILAKLFELPTDLAVGLMAGSLTSTPGLAAAIEALPEGAHVAVAFGIAYPLGVIGAVVFVQLLPRLVGRNLDVLAKELQAEEEKGRRIVRVLVEVRNPAVVGKHLSDVIALAEANCQVSRVLVGDRLIPVSPDFTLEASQHVLVIGPEYQTPLIIDFLGKRSEKVGYIMDTESQRRRIVVTAKDVVGRSLKEMKLLADFGVTVTRIVRHDLEFVPRTGEIVEYGDILRAVGEPENLQRFAEYAGHRAETAHETDLISIGVGVIAGVLLGTVQIGLGDRQFSLGLAGGPLFVALVLAHFGKIGPIVGYLPKASRILVQQIGLALFLSDAGTEAGGQLVATLEQQGATLGIVAGVLVLVPLISGYLFARHVLKLDLLTTLGGICGGMTSTPGLGAITAKTSSQIPVISYAAAYPVALILVTVVAQMLVALL
jgi:putative transport protein